MDDGTIVITPCSSAPGEKEFETPVVDHSRRDKGLADTGSGCNYIGDLHSRKLVFKKNEGPGMWILYLI